MTPATHLAVIVLANFCCGKTPWPLLFAEVILVEATCRWGKLETCSLIKGVIMRLFSVRALQRVYTPAI